MRSFTGDHGNTSDMTKKQLTLDIRLQDCEKFLAGIETGSVDLAFADPPFNINYEYEGYDDNLEPREYVLWCQRWIKEIHRVLKPGGTFWLASGDMFVSFLDVAARVGDSLDMLGKKKAVPGFYRRSWVIWYYTFGVNQGKNFTKSHTHLLYYTKHKDKYTFNKDDTEVRHPSARSLVYKDKRANPAGRLPDDTWFLLKEHIDGIIQPYDDVWSESRVAGTFKHRVTGQSCQMPEPVMTRIIRLCSNPGDLVIDPFCGSGMTAFVANKLGRNAMTCDIDPASIQRANTLCGLKS